MVSHLNQSLFSVSFTWLIGFAATGLLQIKSRSWIDFVFRVTATFAKYLQKLFAIRDLSVVTYPFIWKAAPNSDGGFVRYNFLIADQNLSVESQRYNLKNLDDSDSCIFLLSLPVLYNFHHKILYLHARGVIAER